MSTRPRASHTPEQPHEVPFREVEHQDPTDDERDGFDFIFGLGALRDEVFHGWESKAAEDAYWKEQRRKDAARQKLGRFGFSGQLPPTAP